MSRQIGRQVRNPGKFGPLAVLAAAAALSACGTVQRVGDTLWPFNGGGGEREQASAPQDGRVSILAFEQQLTPDPTLAAQTIVPPLATETVDWSQPGGSADNSPVSIAGTANLEVVWRSNLGAGSNSRVRLAAPPVISEGKLFFLDADHNVRALDAGTGHQLWEHELRPERGRRRDSVARGGGVAAVGGRVFVTTGFGFVAALDAASGEQVWRTPVGAPFHAAPTVAGGRVYAVTNDSELLAFDTATGEQQWDSQAIAEPARILSASSVAVEGDTVIAPFASGELIAFLAANGRKLWTDSLSRSGRLTSLSAINDIAGRPAVEAGTVYAASHSGVLAAIDVRTGQRIWARAFASTQTPWVAGDQIYAVSVDGELCAFDRQTGNIYWVKQLRRYEDEQDREGRVAWTGPILVGGRLVLANSVGDVIAVAPQNGDIQAQEHLGKPFFIPPIAANGSIYLVNDDAKLIVLH